MKVDGEYGTEIRITLKKRKIEASFARDLRYVSRALQNIGDLKESYLPVCASRNISIGVWNKVFFYYC
jgi:hypothetical protein